MSAPHSGPCRDGDKCDRCYAFDYEMLLATEDCEHGRPAYDQCEVCVVLYDDWRDSRDYAI